MGSIGTLMGLDIRVPDYSALSRRANGLSIAQAMRQAGSVAVHLVVDSTGLKIFGEGEWLAQKHKIKGIRRRWRKLHLGPVLHFSFAQLEILRSVDSCRRCIYHRGSQFEDTWNSYRDILAKHFKSIS